MKLTKNKPSTTTINSPLLKSEAISNNEFQQVQISHSHIGQFFYLEYSLCALTDDNITLQASEGKGFYFVYCWQGNLSIGVETKKMKKIIPFQSAIICDKKGKGLKIGVQKNSTNQFCIIGFNKPKSSAIDENSCYCKLQKGFCAHMPKGKYIFIGKPYLKLLEKINILSRTYNSDVASELIMEGLIFQILGLKFEQLLNAVNSEKIDYGSLSSKEMQRVLTISDFIRENPSFEYSIEFLCRETGLSPTKLQEGFKKLYNRTVIDFIRNERLEKATELIKTTDLNITEIVYSIGLTSRSYFSKIFKKKYKCSPKYFQDQNRAIPDIS